MNDYKEDASKIAEDALTQLGMLLKSIPDSEYVAKGDVRSAMAILAHRLYAMVDSYPMMFLDKKQVDRIAEWSEEQDRIIVEKQRAALAKEPPTSNIFQRAMNEAGIPYTGAIGGGLTYECTPTSLGSVTKVSHCMTGKTLDVTDYDW